MWAGTIAIAVAAGTVLGGRFGTMLYPQSYDYIVVPGDYASLGLRLGLLVGALLAAASVAGSRPIPSLQRLAVAFVLVGAVAVVLLIGSGALFVQLFESGVLDTEAWRLPNPRRHALFLGLDVGARWGPLLGAALGGGLLWRGR